MTNDLKPYPEYKDSGVPWLGEIPARWNIRPGFSAFREKKVKNTGMVETRVLSLSYGKIVIKPPEKLHGLVPASFETYQVVDPDDIINIQVLLTMVGGKVEYCAPGFESLCPHTTE